MKLYFVRHGQTDWNKAKKIQGQSDTNLNEYGRYLARETAKGLSGIDFAMCYTSPLWRAKETAQIILNGMRTPIMEEARITEMNFGEYEGKCCSRQGWELPDNFHRFFNDPEHYEKPAGGESFSEVKERTGLFLRELYHNNALGQSNVLITTHGAALAGILCNINQQPISGYWGVGLHSNCGVTEVEVTDGSPKILYENVVYYSDEIAPWEE